MHFSRASQYARRFCQCALFGVLALGVAGSSAGAPVGFVADYRGVVEILPDTKQSFVPVAIDGGVSVGDTIRTDRKSFAKILLVDDTLLEVGGDTEIIIDRMIVGDLATQERSILRELNGHVRAYVGERFGGTTRLEIHTPTAIVGVKGSTMEVWVLDAGGLKTTVVSNVEGQVWVKSAADAGASETPLSEGQSSIVPEGGEPSTPSEGLPLGLTPLPSIPQTVVSNTTTDGILTGGGGVAAGGDGGLGVGDLVTETTTQSLLSQALDITNQVGQSTGPEQSFEQSELVVDTPVPDEEPLPVDPVTPEPPPPPLPTPEIRWGNTPGLGNLGAPTNAKVGTLRGPTGPKAP